MTRRGTFLMFLALASVFAALQYRLWHGTGSIPAARALLVQIADQQAENGGLIERNDQAFAEILELKSGLETVEERARRELGMVKQGETLYVLPNMSDQQ
jgi:cell division protein FtsB